MFLSGNLEIFRNKTKKNTGAVSVALWHQVFQFKNSNKSTEFHMLLTKILTLQPLKSNWNKVREEISYMGRTFGSRFVVNSNPDGCISVNCNLAWSESETRPERVQFLMRWEDLRNNGLRKRDEIWEKKLLLNKLFVPQCFLWIFDKRQKQ